jgi:catechol-2,3-dioxygenase
MTAVTELGYVVFGVSNLAEWRDFAASILGLEVCEEAGEPNRLYLRTDYWHHRIVLEQDGSDDLNAAGLRVAGVEEFAQMRDRLKGAGVAVTACSAEEAAQRRVLDLMRMTDPAGNPIEIFHGPLIEPHKPFLPGRRMHSHVT